ncbi:MAG: TonB-dependent receptor [Bacteroidota bacterium]
MKFTPHYFFFIILYLFLSSRVCSAQLVQIQGAVSSEGIEVPFAKVMLKGENFGTQTNEDGRFVLENIPLGRYELLVFMTDFVPYSQQLNVTNSEIIKLNIELVKISNELNEVVISGTMKEVSKLDSPVPIEVYSARFFRSNPTPSVFEALQTINGVRPQINCNICNTGDIHINGLEGPYTMILIDGMPLVSGLSTVYGLSGIPQSLVDRIEVVKGPASTLYGSEAVGGLINVITKKTTDASLFSADLFGTSWGEINADLAGKFSFGKKVQSLLGVNYFNSSLLVDNNHDNFTDMTLQNRISIFNKWSILRKKNRVFNLAGRYVYEDRWGGDMRWKPEFYGGDSIYGESISTKRWELFGTYQLPFDENFMVQFSANGHQQKSAYGKILFEANQLVGFGQLCYRKELKRHDLLFGAAFRATYYDDNTLATASFDTLNPSVNAPSLTLLPGAFVQDEITLNENHKLLIGVRYDYNSLHGSIFTPRVNYKWNSDNRKSILRMSIGNGYRVANVFTEDHAALTGSREVVFLDDLNPETSWNANINYIQKVKVGDVAFLNFDASVFYTYFTNKIIANYDIDPNKIIYNNLNGYAISKGISLNIDATFKFGLKVNAGATVLDVFKVENSQKVQQLFTEKFMGVWTVSYEIKKWNLNVDYTGNVYSPMRLPLASANDPRQEFSPWWSIQNIQITKKFKKGFEVFGGVKNLLNWTPNRGNPFIIARANDPFDKNVSYNTSGEALVTAENPYGLTFDTSYIYASNQGIKGFVGFRYHFK